ncbi:MAG: Rrf2 family protein [Planctomycetota bacterium]|jgi:Rrf2 family protein
MLRISKKADYAVFLLGAIARQGAYPGGKAADSVVSAHEIAKQAGLNKSVVANLLKEFSRDGLLESVRGLRGGYRLASPPSEISLGQILEVVEGKFVLVDCVPHEIDFPAAGARVAAAKAAAARATAASSDAGSSKSEPAAVEPAAVKPAAVTTKIASSDCSLIGFCPSKQPMRVVHQRISQLFADIHLDELCSMTPVALATATPTAISVSPVSDVQVSHTPVTSSGASGN